MSFLNRLCDKRRKSFVSTTSKCLLLLLVLYRSMLRTIVLINLTNVCCSLPFSYISAECERYAKGASLHFPSIKMKWQLDTESVSILPNVMFESPDATVIF